MKKSFLTTSDTGDHMLLVLVNKSCCRKRFNYIAKVKVKFEAKIEKSWSKLTHPKLIWSNPPPFPNQWNPQWKSALGSLSSFFRSMCRQSMWYQASHTSHWIHCTVSCWGSIHRGAAHGSTAPATSSSSSSSSDEEEDEELDEEEADEVEDDDDEDGEGREGRWGIGYFLGRPLRLLEEKGKQIKLNVASSTTSNYIIRCKNFTHVLEPACSAVKYSSLTDHQILSLKITPQV